MFYLAETKTDLVFGNNIITVLSVTHNDWCIIAELMNKQIN